MKKKRYPDPFKELRCPVCGETFIPAAQHAYKDKRHPYKRVCTYHCVNESQRLKDAERKRKYRKWV